MKDFLGRTIEVGDTIVYPVRFGSSMYLRKGMVKRLNPLRVEVETETWKYDTVKDEGKTIKGRKVVPFYSPARCVIIFPFESRIGVEGLLNDMDA